MNHSDADLLVVGCGLTGLLCGLNAVKAGLKVKILEARGRIGGQIMTKRIPETNSCVDLGAQYVHPRRHPSITALLMKYKLLYYETNVPEDQTYWLSNDDIYDETTSTRDLLPMLLGDQSFLDILMLINKDLSSLSGQPRLTTDMEFINFASGYHDVTSDFSDMPFVDYVNSRLKAKGKARDFILAQAFCLGGADLEHQSTLSILYAFAGFGSAERALESLASLSSIPDGMGLLIHRLAADFISLGGEIVLNKPILSIHLKKDEGKSYMHGFVRMPAYDMVHIYSNKGELFVGRSVVVALPLPCVGSISFLPSIPESIRKCALRCHGNPEGLKVWAKATGISKRTQQILSPAMMLKRSCVKQQKQPTVATTATTATTGGGMVTAGAAADNSSAPFDIVSVHGLRKDLLPVEEKVLLALKKHHPMVSIYLPDGNLKPLEGGTITTTAAAAVATTSAPCKPAGFTAEAVIAQSMTSDGKDPFSIEGIVTVLPASSSFAYHDFTNDPWTRGSWFCLRAGMSPLHKTAIWDAKSPWNSKHVTGGPRFAGYFSSVEGVATSVTTLLPSTIGDSEHGNDGGGDGGGGGGDSGTEGRPEPGDNSGVNEDEINRNVLKILRVRDEHTVLAKKFAEDNVVHHLGVGGSSVEPTTAKSIFAQAAIKDSDCLIITGGDLSEHWTGWLEGSVLAAKEASATIIKYLKPPEVERNAVRRIPPPPTQHKY